MTNAGSFRCVLLPFMSCAPLKWNAKYSSLLQASSTLDRLKGVPIQQQYLHMYHVQQLLQELERLTRLDDGLREARPFILTLW